VERSAATALGEAYAFKLLHDLKGTPVWLPAYLGIATGLREGEMLALMWGDIDLKLGTVTVTHSLEQVGREIRRKETKTARSRRTVAIGPDLCRELVSHRRHLKERHLRLANFWHESGYVFPSLHHVGEHYAGRAWSPGAFKAAWRKATRAAGWTIRYHDLRHTHATLLMRAGLPANEVAAQLGHSGTGLVLDLYGHVHSDRRRAVVDVVDAALG
jgi:integrase